MIEAERRRTRREDGGGHVTVGFEREDEQEGNIAAAMRVEENRREKKGRWQGNEKRRG